MYSRALQQQTAMQQQQCSTALGVLLWRQMKLTKAELTKPAPKQHCHDFADAGLH